MKKIQQLMLMLAIIGWSNIVNAQQAGTLDAAFIPASSIETTIRTSALQTNGKIILGGSFSKGIARLNEDGSIDNSFNSGNGADTSVSAIVIQNDGKIIIGGHFTSYNGVASRGIARLNTDGSLDTTFLVGLGIDSTGLASTATVSSIALQTDDKIIIGGNFSNYNGTTIFNVARLNTNGTLDTTFISPSMWMFSLNGGSVNSIAIQNNGKIIIGGRFHSNFTNPAYLGISFYHNFLLRMHGNGEKDTTFIAHIGPTNVGYVSVVKLQSDGKILVGGNFQTCNATPVGNLIRLNEDATLDTSFIGSVNGMVQAINIQEDGKLLVGTFKGVAYSSDTIALVFRLNTNGRKDTSFHRGIIDKSNVANYFDSASDVYTIQIQSDDKIIIGGNFISYDGATRNGIVRLNASNPLSIDNTSLEDENKLNIFPNPSNGVFNVAFQQEMRHATIRIIDVLGKEIYHSSVDKDVSVLNIDISNYDKGIYSIIVNLDGKHYKSKLVVN